MDFQHLVAPVATLSEVATDALLLVLREDGPSAQPDMQIDPLIAALIQDAVKAGDLPLKPGRTLYVHRPHGLRAARVALVVVADASPKAFKAALAHGLGLLKGSGAKHVTVARADGAELTALHAEALPLAAADATYLYRHTKPSAPAAPAMAKFTLVCSKPELRAVRLGLARGAAIAEGVTLARECANRPANFCTPTYLADEAKKLGKAHGLKVEVLDRKDVEKLGMGAFLAVAQGSVEPLKFIVARYEGAAKSKAPLVLVGKGITFDTGGISIKPAADMDEMKFDMGGAASVLGTLRAVAELKPKINLIGVIAACENMPSGNAVKPGDVVKSMSGQTIEVLNTDAEGRLVLCDALTYVERFKPAAVVDIATLTGACVVALGHHLSGLFTADDALAAELLQAGVDGCDRAWRLPIDEDYDEALKSNFADMGNVGGRAGGAITAAMFLRRFTKKYRWAHLDIAGSAWKSGAAKGSTGRPVPLLTHFVLSFLDGHAG